jgi:hypothetical protein
VPKPVVCPDANDGRVGLEHSQNSGVERDRAAVMPHFQDLDMPYRTACHQPVQHRGLRVAGEQRASLAPARDNDDAGLVGPRIDRAVLRRHNLKRDRSHVDRTPRIELGDSIRPDKSLPLAQGLTRLVSSALRNAELADADQPAQRRQTADVVGVEVGQHDSVKRAHPLTAQRRTQASGVRTRVDQHLSLSVSNKDGIALPDVHHYDARGHGR